MTSYPLSRLLAVAAFAGLGLAACGPRADSEASQVTPPVDQSGTARSMTSANPASGGMIDGDTADVRESGRHERGSRRADRPRSELTLAGVQERSDRMFDRIDGNRDGVLSAAEYQAAGSGRADASDAGGDDDRGRDRAGKADKALTRADANHDGWVTREEARAVAVRRFERMDKNGDGVVGDDERPRRRDTARSTSSASS